MQKSNRTQRNYSLFLNVLLLTGDTDMMFEMCGCTIYDHAADELRQIIDRSVCRT
jgi:hypothetical protein